MPKTVWVVENKMSALECCVDKHSDGEVLGRLDFQADRARRHAAHDHHPCVTQARVAVTSLMYCH